MNLQIKILRGDFSKKSGRNPDGMKSRVGRPKKKWEAETLNSIWIIVKKYILE